MAETPTERTAARQSAEQILRTMNDERARERGALTYRGITQLRTP